MSAVAERLPIPAAPPDPDLVDHWVLLHGVPWAEYERLLAVRGKNAVPRLTSLDGELELRSPSIHHEGRFLPDLDPRLLAECMAAPSQNAALRLLRERLGPAGAGGA